MSRLGASSSSALGLRSFKCLYQMEDLEIITEKAVPLLLVTSQHCLLLIEKEDRIQEQSDKEGENFFSL